jgi:Ca2+-binding RTX toxin-like protein
LIQWWHLLADGGRVWSLSPTKRKGKRLVRRTILFLGVMTLMLAGAGGVAFALVDCDPFQGTCTCHKGVPCEGTSEGDNITGTESDDEIRGYGGDDNINGSGGSDHIDGGPHRDIIEGDGGSFNRGKDTLIGGSGIDDCWGTPGVDTFDVSCENKFEE